LNSHAEPYARADLNLQRTELTVAENLQGNQSAGSNSLGCVATWAGLAGRLKTTVKNAARPVIFKWRQTAPELILCAVRWYLRYSRSLRDVEELLAERGLAVVATST
jgi:hypothetical protein